MNWLRIRSPRAALFWMGFPCFLLILAFYYVPLFGWIYAFFNYVPGLPLADSQYVGLKFFKIAFLDPDIYRVLRNTLVMSLLGMLCSPLPVVFAILISEISKARYRKFLQTVTTLPNFVSWVLVFSVFFSFFSIDDGLLNHLILWLHPSAEPSNLLGNSDVAWYFQTAVGIWKTLGFGSIVYFAAISSIDQEQYDAAKVDGAGLFQQIRHITVPGIIPTYVALLLLSVGSILSSGFEQFFVFNNVLVNDKLEVLDLYIYRIGLTMNDYSYAITVGIAKSVVSIILLFVANGLAKRLRGESLM